MSIKIDNVEKFKADIKLLGFKYVGTATDGYLKYDDFTCRAVEPNLTVFINYTEEGITADIEVEGYELPNVKNLGDLKTLVRLLKNPD